MESKSKGQTQGMIRTSIDRDSTEYQFDRRWVDNFIAPWKAARSREQVVVPSGGDQREWPEECGFPTGGDKLSRAGTG